MKRIVIVGIGIGGLSELTRQLGESRQDVGPKIRLVIASLGFFF